jgi:hypothetical protein
LAQLNPSLDIIQKQKVKPTEGEFKLLNFLISILDNSYEIYFQPFLNGDCPDIVIMKRGYGVIIIEVKDWNLDNYSINESTNWVVKKNNTEILSPLKQVVKYKENLFHLHIKDLYFKHIKDIKHWDTVGCMVYFHNATEKQVESFLLSNYTENKYENYRKFVGTVGIIGSDSLVKEKLESKFQKNIFNRSSEYFDETLYNSFFRYLQAPIHQKEEGIDIRYTPEQQELCRSEIKPRRKIKGVAGSGKTLVLAKRAVNAYKRTGGTILILTYNLSLKNYIHDRLNDVREEFSWNKFYITNYHQFFKGEATNYNIIIKNLVSFQDENFFEDVKDKIFKYDVVLIDEIQDYRQEWINIIAKYFIHEETEFIVFGDEKQNIYERVLDDKNEIIVRTIRAEWNKSLSKSHRFTSNIGNLATKFQKNIFKGKYNNDQIITMSTLDFTTRIIEYHFFENYNSKFLTDTIFNVIKLHNIHSSDVGILCAKVEILREIDHIIKNNYNERTNTTFETLKEYSDYEKNKGVLENIRRNKKFHFWMKSGTIKLSTTHSFKGWEIDTLFLIIENDIKATDFDKTELIYTGITRARRNLIIFNLNNRHYDSFFRQEIENVIIHR